MLTIDRKMMLTHYFGQHPFIALCVMIIVNVAGYLADYIPGTLLTQIPLDIDTVYAMKEAIIFVLQITSYSVAIYVGYLAIKKHKEKKEEK